MYGQLEVPDSVGGSSFVDQYTYDAALGHATWRVNLAGLNTARLGFDRSGNDPTGDYAPNNEFQETSNFDGVALSVDGENWIVLEEFGSTYSEGSNPSQIDLVALAAQHGPSRS